jgi:hypothetical protein
MCGNIATMRQPLLLWVILAVFGVVWVAAMVVGPDASNSRPPSAIDDSGMSVPLDQFSARRLAVLQAMKACAENPGKDFVRGGDVTYICNERGAPPPYRPASAPELPPLVTMPPTRPASQSR